MSVPSNHDDIIDSRDIIEHIESLREELENGSITAEEREDLAALEEFADALAGYCPDWKYGVTLVRDSYWVEYVQELLEDIGYIPADLPGWIHIDWDRTADEVQIDYTSAEYDGVTYWAR